MPDIEERAQQRAEELAQERYNCDYDELPAYQAVELYWEAYHLEEERLNEAAESREDR